MTQGNQSTGFASLRIGQGYDVHALVPGRHLLLGGVKIEHELGLLGHSDADALLHAITDALLGALALGDIGSHFPDTDAQFKGADSAKLLSQAYEKVREAGYVLLNLDATIIAQRPKLAPYREAMRRKIADLLQVQVDQVSVKAKTSERLGFVGREEGIEAHAVVLLTPLARL